MQKIVVITLDRLTWLLLITCVEIEDGLRNLNQLKKDPLYAREMTH